MISKKDLAKETLYTAVKTLVETPSSHIHLPQQKLFTLFSIAFQYVLFHSTKNPGHYIIRVEDSFLAEKLARKSKDESTRRFLQKLMVPRRLVYGNSTFHLDYFTLGSWAVTKDLPRHKIQAAIIVKNTSRNPLIDEGDYRHTPEDSQNEAASQLFGKHYYLSSLMESVPKTVTIAFDEEFEGTEEVNFGFIEEETEATGSGVRISADVSFDD